jgi:hypothetical protein
MSKIKSLIVSLEAALNEKDVENIWRAWLSSQYKDCKVTSPFKCDGYLEFGHIAMLCEFKYELDLLNKKDSLKVIAQSIYYLRKFKTEGSTLPNILFIADKNECFVLSTTILKKYYDGDYDWSLAPSEAGSNLKLLSDLSVDDAIIPMVFKIGESFDWSIVNYQMTRIILQAKADVAINSQNIRRAFEYWTANVVDPKISVDDSIKIFYSVLSDPVDCYPHPKKDNVLIVKDEEFKINKRGFIGFFKLYKENHNPLELRELTANKDRLVEEFTRRKTGAFFTPSIWVDEAHKMIEDSFGANWKNEYVVWDASCGTANLTRDYQFKELYLSTLDATDLAVIETSKFNPEAVKFQFDFLNDGLDKLPAGLKSALENGKKILFLNNPPYAAVANDRKDSGTTNLGIANTMVKKRMDKNKIGGASKNLYTQFMYRIIMLMEQYDLQGSGMATFSKSKFLTSTQFKGFRTILDDNLKYADGMVFQASHFSDVSAAWGVIYTIFKNEKKTEKNVYAVKVKDVDLETNKIVVIDNKLFYSVDSSKRGNLWVRTKSQNMIEFPNFKNAVSIRPNGIVKTYDNAIGTFLSNANNVQYNQSHVSILPGPFVGTMDVPITKDNFERIVSFFTARNIIQQNWINDNDEYMVPNADHPDYRQFVNDSIVWAIFNGCQSAMRSVEYTGKTWDIPNEFFFMSNSEMRELAVEHSFNDLYSDTMHHQNDRFVYDKLKGLTLSADVADLLDYAKMLVRQTFAIRKDAHNLNPELHLNAWDAGWWQIKRGLLKENFKNELKLFNEKAKTVRTRMIPLIYELGFLHK